MSPVGGRGGDTVFGVPLGRTRIASLRSHVRESFGKVVMAMMMLPRYRQQTLADLQHLVLEPLIRDRIAIAQRADAGTRNSMSPAVPMPKGFRGQHACSPSSFPTPQRSVTPSSDHVPYQAQLMAVSPRTSALSLRLRAPGCAAAAFFFQDCVQCVQSGLARC